MNRESFVAQGRADAERGLKAAYHKPGTWQERAYTDGYNGYVPHAARERSKSILLPIMALRELILQKAQWPTAAQKHAEFLLNELAKEAKAKRRARLLRAVKRLAKRHTPRQHAQNPQQATWNELA